MADVHLNSVLTEMENYQIGVFVVLIRTATQTGAMQDSAKISSTETRSAIQIIDCMRCCGIGLIKIMILLLNKVILILAQLTHSW